MGEYRKSDNELCYILVNSARYICSNECPWSDNKNTISESRNIRFYTYSAHAIFARFILPLRKAHFRWFFFLVWTYLSFRVCMAMNTRNHRASSTNRLHWWAKARSSIRPRPCDCGLVIIHDCNISHFPNQPCNSLNDSICTRLKSNEVQVAIWVCDDSWQAVGFVFHAHPPRPNQLIMKFPNIVS